MKAFVDPDLCIGCTQCTGICPEVFQMIDLKEKEMSRGEFENVARALGGWEQLVNPAAKDKQTLALLDALVDWQKEDKLFENQQLFKTPIVRNGKKATVGYQPEIWKTWE